MSGIAISFSAVGASVLIATCMDYFRNRMKAALLCLLAASCLVCSLATLITEGVVRVEDVSTLQILLYVLLILGISLSCGAAPLAFEFCVELCYPVSEGSLGNWLVLWFNSLSAVYFSVVQADI